VECGARGRFVAIGEEYSCHKRVRGVAPSVASTNY
jgi:hypothetical protein